MHPRRRTLFGILLVGGASASARPISFGEARAAAERLSPDVLLAARRLDVARADIHVAGALANPAFTATTAAQTARLGMTLSVPVPLFGQRGTAIDAATADSRVAALDAAVTAQDARWSATQAWIDLWEAQERSNVLAQAASDADRLLGIAKERFDSGSAPRLDVVRATADRARAAADASFAKTAIQSAASRLGPWIGETTTGGLEATGQPGFAGNLPDLSTLQAVISRQRVLKRDRAGIEAAEAHVRAEERQRWPVIDAQLSVNLFDPSLEQVPGATPSPLGTNDIIGGISFELPVLSLRGGAIERARAEKAVAEATVSADEARLIAALRDAYQHTQGAAEQVRSLRTEALPAMEEARRMTEEGYRAGRVDLLRLLEAQRALLDTRLAVAEAVANWSRACADLERAAGEPLDGKVPHGE